MVGLSWSDLVQCIARIEPLNDNEEILHWLWTKNEKHSESADISRGSLIAKCVQSPSRNGIFNSSIRVVIPITTKFLSILTSHTSRLSKKSSKFVNNNFWVIYWQTNSEKKAKNLVNLLGEDNYSPLIVWDLSLQRHCVDFMLRN